MEESPEEQFDNWADVIIAVGSTGTAALIGYTNKPHPALLEMMDEDEEFYTGWDNHDAGLYLVTIKMEKLDDPYNDDIDGYLEITNQKEVCSGDDLIKLFCKTCGRFNDVRCQTVGCAD